MCKEEYLYPIHYKKQWYYKIHCNELYIERYQCIEDLIPDKSISIGNDQKIYPDGTIKSSLPIKKTITE